MRWTLIYEQLHTVICESRQLAVLQVPAFAIPLQCSPHRNTLRHATGQPSFEHTEQPPPPPPSAART